MIVDARWRRVSADAGLSAKLAKMLRTGSPTMAVQASASITVRRSAALPQSILPSPVVCRSAGGEDAVGSMGMSLLNAWSLNANEN